MPQFSHQPVLLTEAINLLNIKPSGIYVDATIGGAGHAFEIIKNLNKDGRLIGIDQDQLAITVAQERLKEVRPKVDLFRRNFVYLAEILKELDISSVDGFLFDLGVSSPQFELDERGFSYKNDAPLDMRMDQTQPFSAAHLVNTAPVNELEKIIREYGEERWSKRIAQFIDKNRRDKEIKTTCELAEIIKQAIPAAARRTGPHPARRSFQALRIAVNHEIEFLKKTLDQAIRLLKPKGRIVVISFHSLEDRLVKATFIDWARECECPREFPVCNCNRTPRLKIITKKPIIPSKEEIVNNHRARSAKLRSAEKLV